MDIFELIATTILLAIPCSIGFLIGGPIGALVVLVALMVF